jgi:microcystin-dependent protein
MNYAETYPLNVTPQGDSTRSAVEKNRKEILSLVAALNAQPSGAVGGSRQRVLSASMLSGAWNFLSSDGLAVIINGSVTPVIMSFADGCGENGNIDYIGVVRDKLSAWQLPANNTSYLYIERSDAGALTYGSTTIAPVEQDSTPSAGTNDASLCWFSTLESKMYVWTGSAWQHKVRLFVGTAKTDGSTVNSITYKEYPQQLAPSLQQKLKEIEAEATKNENCISAIKIGDVTVTANGHQDTFTITAEGLIALSADSNTRTIKLSTPDLSNVYAQAKLDAHPVGSIYESTDSTSPATLFGGTWETMDAGRVLVAQGKAATGTTFTAGATGGEETHTLTTSELPVTNVTVSGTTNAAGNHRHSISTMSDESSESNPQPAYGNGSSKTGYTNYDGDHVHLFTGSGTFGGGESHNNLPPYTVVYRWRRTA